MKKKNFVTLLLATVGGILFALGMCMALLPQWGLFNQGIALEAAGLAVLLVLVLVRRRMAGKPLVKITPRTLGTALLGLAGVLALGVGMCMAMVWNIMAAGIGVGILGILLLLCLIPAIRGLR